MSKAMHLSPAEILKISDEFVAYAFNSAVVLWGTSFDAALEEAVHGAKTQEQAENKQASAVRRWIPSTKRYR